MFAFRCKCSYDQYMRKGTKTPFVDVLSKLAGLHLAAWLLAGTLPEEPVPLILRLTSEVFLAHSFK